MTPARRTVVAFATIWLPLALLQYARAFHACADGTGWLMSGWSLQLGLLIMPMVAVARLLRRDARETGETAAVLLILLAYVPVTLALSLAERCGALL